MRKRGKRDSSICSYIPVGARGTTTVTVPKRKSGKRTEVPLNWEVLELRNCPTREGLGHVDACVHSLHLPNPPVPSGCGLSETLRTKLRQLSEKKTLAR